MHGSGDASRVQFNRPMPRRFRRPRTKAAKFQHVCKGFSTMNASCRVRMAIVDQWRPHDNRLHQLTRAFCITRTPWAERTIEASKPIQGER